MQRVVVTDDRRGPAEELTSGWTQLTPDDATGAEIPRCYNSGNASCGVVLHPDLEKFQLTHDPLDWKMDPAEMGIDYSRFIYAPQTLFPDIKYLPISAQPYMTLYQVNPRRRAGPRGTAHPAG